MIPDLIELDELQTGQGREGVFYSLIVLLQKFGLSFGLFLVGNALQASGFKEAVVVRNTLPIQLDSALLVIRIAVRLIPIICLAIGLIVTFLYPINREMHAEIILKLQERQEIGG
jgi:GPH family glycoside/pentoside/hexuronide:cation symporter